MPNLDKTGPRGLGAMTGRGLGKCNQSFASKPNQIQHETGEPHTDRYRISNQPTNDVFVRRRQNRNG